MIVILITLSGNYGNFMVTLVTMLNVFHLRSCSCELGVGVKEGIGC